MARIDTENDRRERPIDGKLLFRAMIAITEANNAWLLAHDGQSAPFGYLTEVAQRELWPEDYALEIPV